MSPERDSAIRVRLDSELRERLDEFCKRTRRNLTNAVALLLENGLDTIDEPRSDDKGARGC